MKKTTIFICTLCAVVGMMSAQQIQRVEPLSWWTDMRTPLTLMLYGDNLKDAQVTIQKKQGKKAIATDGLVVKGQHNAESANYLFIDMDVRKAGDYIISVKKGKKTAKVSYSIAERKASSADRKSFTEADVIYLIMSDRFVDGDPSNNTTKHTKEECNKESLDGRWGGDIQGIINSMDYISSLGATAIWPTPLLLDDEEAWSYHGYACSDYYHIDPRFGSNEQYKEMVKIAHQKELKIIMDMVPNHCGLEHWWIKDLPYQDWIHQYPEFTQTNNAFSTAYDPCASQYDRDLNESGWFDTHMPDMNLDNTDLLQYFKQWAIWWIEEMDLDGLRVDTYPYNEKTAASEWCKAIRNEYPNINIVGECWTRPVSEVAYWQADHNNADGFNSNLPSVMNFPLEEAIRQALETDGSGWGNGLTRVYDAVAQNYQYANINNVLLFVGNHDMEHITDIVKDNDLRRVRIASTLLATLHGTPQLFQGDEYGQRSADISKGHSGLRRPLLEREKWNQEQKDLFDYTAALFNYRKHSSALQKGKLMHFMSRDNTYAYFRYTKDEAVFVFINAAEEERIIPVKHYAEILDRFGYNGTDIITGKTVELKDGLTIAPLSTLVVRMK